MADYDGLGSENDFYANNNPIKSGNEFTSDEDLPLEMTRQNPHYTARAEQMMINILSVAGGRPYVQKRLTRWAGETTLDFKGGERYDGDKVSGRLQQSHSFPYPKRIVDKINQYVFNEPPTRDGVDEAFELDASADGCSLDDLMIQANEYVTSCSWCWIGIDSPDLGDEPVSKAEQQASKIRPYWSIYSPTSVPDWKFNAIGELEWLITEGVEYSAGSPKEAPQTLKVRRIWSAGEVEVIKQGMDEDGKWVEVSRVTTSFNYDGVPFVLVGKIIAGGYSFDDIESINRTIMDLESVNRANFFRSSYPQIVLPATVLQNVADAYATDVAGATSLVFGQNSPILISEGDINPFYLMPDSGALKAPREEIQALKYNMFDSVGLMLQSESKQVASAESKAWDFLDVAQVMKARAQTLEEAETRAAKITAEFDPSMSEWTPIYNRDFDIGDFSEELNALIMTVNAPMPVEMSRVILEKILNRVERVGSGIDDDTRQIVVDAIKEFNPTAMGIPELENLTV